MRHEYAEILEATCGPVYATIGEILGRERGGGLDDDDIERLQRLTHTLKNVSVVKGMLEEENGGGWSQADEGRSGARMRNRRTGRFYSGNDGGNAGGGNSRAMGARYSGNSYAGGDMDQMIGQVEQILEQMKGQGQN